LLEPHFGQETLFIPNLGELIESIYLYSTSVEVSSKVHTNSTTSAAQRLKLGIGALRAKALTH